MKTRMLKALAILAVGLPLASCNKGGGESVSVPDQYVMPESFSNITLKVWDSISGQDGTAYAQMINEFNDQYFGQIYVERVPNPTDTAYYSNIELALGQDDGPDVVETGSDIVAQWGYQGNILADLTPIFDAIGEPIDASDFDQNILDAGKWDGAQIELPMGLHGTVLFINDTVWDTYFPDEEQPEVWTRDLVKKYGSKVKELSGGKVYGLPMSSEFPGNTYGQFDAFYQNGGKFTLAPDDYTVNFYTQAGIDGIKSFTEIIFNGGDSFGGADNRIGNDTDLNWFNSKQSLFLVDGTWCLPNIYTAVESDSFEWHAAPISGLYALDPDKDYADSILVQSHNFGITLNCAADNDKACAAAVFVDWMTKNCVPYCSSGHIAARKSVRETQEYKDACPHHEEFGDPTDFILNEPNPAVLYMQNEYSGAMSDIIGGGSNDDTTINATLEIRRRNAEQEIEQWLASY